MVFKKVVTLLSEIISVDHDDITADTEFNQEYGIEPIDLAKLIIAAEKKFKITIHDEDVGSFRKVGDLVKYIEILNES